jgi:hypothetical protein
VAQRVRIEKLAPEQHIEHFVRENIAMSLIDLQKANGRRKVALSPDNNK